VIVIIVNLKLCDRKKKRIERDVEQRNVHSRRVLVGRLSFQPATIRQRQFTIRNVGTKKDSGERRDFATPQTPSESENPSARQTAVHQTVSYTVAVAESVGFGD
jgi:hypothetical protein